VKILFVSNIFPPHVRGGYELACLELAENYVKLGHVVTVASSENTYKLCKYPEPTHLDVRRIFTPVRFYDEKYDQHFRSGVIYSYERIMAFAGYVESNCIALKRLIEAEDPDLIWIFNPLGIGPVGIIDVSVSSGKKVIIHLMEHIDNFIIENAGIINLTSKWKELKSQITAISCSEKILNSNSTLGNYYANEVIYNWVDLNNIPDKNFPKLSAENFIEGDKDSSFKIIYFGQVNEKKGILQLYKLAQKISVSQFKNRIKIDIYGKGEDKFIDTLKSGIQEDSDLAKIFSLRGFLDKDTLLEILPSYNLGIFLLSDDEPFAFAPIEAMSCGVPVMITSGPGGVNELFQDKYDVLLVEDRRNISEMYRKLIWCIENPNALQGIRKNAIQTLKNSVDLDSVVIPALNKLIEHVPNTKGYSFDYVLSTCDMLKYPHFDFAFATTAFGSSIRYKFIDLVINSLYRLPVVSEYFPIVTKSLVKYYKNAR
jgi:glycogen synthase